jgi:predicted MFS family arabinose efflux permease
MSLGSAAGGLAYGARNWHAPLARQFSVVLALMGAGVALLAAVSNAWLFAALSVLAGVVMAPALTIQSMLVAKIVSARHATEAFTWSASGLLSGVGLGIAAGGWLIEAASSAATFAAAAAAAFGASLLAAALKATAQAPSSASARVSRSSRPAARAGR